MTSATPCPICGRTLNGALCCQDCGTPVGEAPDHGPGPLPPTVERLPARRDAAATSAPLPELGALPPEDVSAFAAPAPGGDFPSEPVPGQSRPDAPPPRRRKRTFGKIALVAVLVAAVAYGGAAALSLDASEQPESAPVKQPQQNRQGEPSTPPAGLPSVTPSPRVTGSDPLPPEPTRTGTPAPPPPSPTPRPETTAPPSPTPEPEFSWPSGWPTPTACESGWCWPGDRGGYDDPRDRGGHDDPRDRGSHDDRSP